MPLPLSALAGSPFDTYLVPGLILFGVLGLGPLVAARLAWLRHPLAPTAALVVGVGLLIWVAVEVAIIVIATSHRCRGSTRPSVSRSSSSPAAGSMGRRPTHADATNAAPGHGEVGR